MIGLPISAEGECISLHTRIQELDLEYMVGNNAALPDELVEPLPGHGAWPSASTSAPWLFPGAAPSM